MLKGDACEGGGEGVLVAVELLAELGEFGLEEAGGGACFGDGFFLFRELALEV